MKARDTAGRPWSEALDSRLRDNPAIAAAWARGQVRKLEDRYVVGAGNSGALERHIIAVSLRFGVLSRFTAYVAIDRSEPANTTGQLHRITQPVETPQGWGLDRPMVRALGQDCTSRESCDGLRVSAQDSHPCCP